MEITYVRVFPIKKGDFKAYAIIIVDRSLMIRDVKVICGPNGYFVGMPSRKQAKGGFFEIVSPITGKVRKLLEERILDEYERVTGEPVTRRKLK
jgi:stage V sporulation protein G